MFSVWPACGHVPKIGQIGLRLVVSVKIGPASQKGNPLEWRSCRNATDLATREIVAVLQCLPPKFDLERGI